MNGMDKKKTEVESDQHFMEEVRLLNESTYIIRFTRNGMTFRAGQHLVIGLKGEKEAREYSIYSAEQDESLEVLIKEVDEGLVSKQLRHLRAGDPLEVKGPFGFFLSDAPKNSGQKMVFIASGTGIAPFHSFIRSNPGYDYQVIHGIRNIDEAYEKEHYTAERYISCTSRGHKGTFAGRVTDYLLNHPPDPGSNIFLCGNSNMIYDSMDILQSQGFTPKQLFTEVYF